MQDELLSIIQRDFPLSSRPFREIAEKLSTNEDEIIELVLKLKEQKIIRQISAIFDTKSLGYKSSLVAFKVPDEKIEKTVEIINSHPGVSHNYERDHDYNIWFTIAVEGDSLLGLEKSVELLAKLSGVEDYLILPTLKMFKISVKLDTTGKAKSREKVEKKSFSKLVLTPKDKEIINLAQNDIEITKEPFKEMVEELGIGYDEFFESLERYKKSGLMRRYAGILNHKRAGFGANAMTVWDVDEDNGEEMGMKAASFSAVSHCYLRPKYPDWNYNLFTMIHAKSKDEIDAIIKEMEQEIPHNSKRLLYSTREFKKVRLKYFTKAFQEWEERHKEMV